MSSPKRIGTEFDFDNLGNNLKKIRKGLRKTQSEVAEELGVTPGYISNVENSNTAVSFRVISYYCKIGKITMDDLVCGNVDRDELPLIDQKILASAEKMPVESKERMLSIIKTWFRLED